LLYAATAVGSSSVKTVASRHTLDAYSNQAHREPQRRRRNTRGDLKHFHRAPLGKIVNFSFQNSTFWRTVYFWPTAGPQTSRGPG